MSSMFHNKSGIYQQAFRLMLCLCMWRGPVPMMHHHSHSPESHAAQAAHIRTFHEASPVCFTEWHWHLVTPGSLPEHSGDSPQRNVVEDLLSLICSPESHANDVAVLNEGLLIESFDFRVSVGTEPPISNAPGSFLNTLLPSKSLAAVTGTAII
ncbi:MAG: hypothetical protein KDA91_15975 [Planctomycetaceae bacterium]|nr:hypothetical protein [Planctomycetaceae bacterium]